MAEYHRAETQIEDWIRVRQLGSGACGTVYMWKNSKNNKEIAIKKCKHLDNQDAISRWKTEVGMIQGMSHSNIVSYIKIPTALKKEYPSYCSLGMEFCSCGDLRKFIAKTEHGCGLPEYHLRDVMGDIGSAIHYLHEKNNMHRDLKPENIVLKPRPGAARRFLYKITDLGYAKDLATTRGHTLVGTLQYLAPELVLQPKWSLCYNTEVDSWSFGIVVFECSTGFRPFFHLSNSEPPLAIDFIKEKSDKDICAWHEDTDKVKFYDGIPQPHLLNPHFASDIVSWLRLMLCFDKEKRGGKAGKAWYSILERKILAKKYVKVFNTATMSLITFPLEETAMPRTVQMMIQRETSVADADQLLLVEKGEVLNMTVRILDQLKQIEPDSPIIYVYDKLSRQWPCRGSTTPEKIRLYYCNQSAITDYKRFLQIALHETLSKIRMGIHVHNAVFALMERVKKISENLKTHLHEFMAENYTLDGKVNLFELSLRKDMAEVESQRDTSELCSGDDYKKECKELLKSIEGWKKEVKEAKELIAEAFKELSKTRNSSDLLSKKEQLEALKEGAVKFCTQFRLQYKILEQKYVHSSDERNFAEFSAKTTKSFCKNHLRIFMEEYWTKARKLVEDCLSSESKQRKQIHTCTDYLLELERIHFNIQNKKQHCLCVSSELEEKQRSRQHSLWNMLKYMKVVYNIAHSNQQDPTSLEDLTGSEKRLCNFTERFINDPDLQQVIHFTPPNSMQQQVDQIHQPRPVRHYHQGTLASINRTVPTEWNSSDAAHGSHPVSSNDSSALQISSQKDPPSIPNGGSS